MERLEHSIGLDLGPQLLEPIVKLGVEDVLGFRPIESDDGDAI